MKTKEVKQQKAADAPYVAPAIEIIDIELTQNIPRRLVAMVYYPALETVDWHGD
ncbi:MAG: hypothetical protein ACOX19_06005 [Fermentimonas sp.]